MMRQYIKQNILIAILFFLTVIAILLLILEIINLNKIVFGLKVADIKIGGLETEEARNLLKARFGHWEKEKIQLIYDNEKFYVTPEELGISLNLDKTIEECYSVGRQKNIIMSIYEQIVSILPLERKKIIPTYDFKQEKFESSLKEKFINIEKPAKFASLEYDFKKRDFKITPSEEGFIFDRKKLKKDLEERIKNLNSEPINLILIKDFPKVLEDETLLAKKQANLILATAPFYLVYNGQKWPLDRETLVDWLNFIPIPEPTSTSLEKEEIKEESNKILGVTLDREKIKNILITISPQINQEPVNAQLTVKEGKVVVFTLSRDGIRLDIEKSATEIIDSIVNDKNNSAILSFEKKETESPLALSLEDRKPKEIGLVVEKKPATITIENIDTLGLTSLLGKGTSNFVGSPKNRMHNIKIGAAKFNGVLIAPNEEFSFNQILGEIGPKQGYLPELVIKKNKTIPEYGGGLCQVSTTMFRAAVNSGLKITERYSHAYPVKYYNPQGFDATIYPPHPDLRFINDTPRYILIQAKIEGTILTFEIYGTSDGREVKIKGPITLQVNPDGSMKTILYQQIWRNGRMEHEDKFYSSYKSPALYPVIRNPLE